MLHLAQTHPNRAKYFPKLQRLKADIIIGDDGIIRLVAKADAEIEAEDAQTIVTEFMKLTAQDGRDKYLLLSDARQLLTISTESQEIFNSIDFGMRIKANAIVVETLPVRLIANFFISFHKPCFPAKIFNDEQTALEWLNGFEN
jgi:tetraacyldisaccharide-1-P 4'-kinase